MNFCFWKERPSLISLILNLKQESIPVGCIPTMAVASTPVGVGVGGRVYPTIGYPTPWIPYTNPPIPYRLIPYPLYSLHPRRDLILEIPYPRKGHVTSKEPGTSDTLPLPSVNRQTPVRHYLPLAVDNKKNTINLTICDISSNRK